jgi:hypothetical protein
MSGKGKWGILRKPAPVSLCPPQIPHDLIQGETWAAAVGRQRLTAWTMAWPKASTWCLNLHLLAPVLVVILIVFIANTNFVTRLPLWSCGQSSRLLTQRSRVRFPALPIFLHSSRSGTDSTQPHEDKWGATWKKSSGSGLENWNQRPWGFRRANHVTPFYPQKLALNFADKWRSLSRYSSLGD